jgi:molecular chaperone HscC
MIIGIDLGTTNSCAAYWSNGKATLIPNRLGNVLTPSAISIDEKDNLIVGLAARERQSTHPKLTSTAFKRYMGTQKRLSLGKKSYLAEELSSFVLRSLKEDAETFLGTKIAEAVITVPAYFNDKQRKATKRAGELAGFKVERLISEPTAAALAYGIHELANETQFLVFDLGGGTFDVSILEMFEGVIEVRATTGDNKLGGEDFNEILIKTMRQKFEKEWGDDAHSNDTLYQLLRASAERARRALSNSNDGKMTVVWKKRLFETAFTADEFEGKCITLLERLRHPVQRALRDGALKLSDIEEIILVGGATRMPIIRRALTRMFGRFPAYAVNPDEAVALGAAIQAGLKARDKDLKEVAVTDVCPYSLGVGISERDARGNINDGIFSPIIERNTVVPASREEYYSTMQSGQTKIELQIYQGESRNVFENINLGKITVKVPPKPAGEVIVNCRFSYDINGLLEVDVFVPATGKTENMVIVDEDCISGEALIERQKVLAKLKQHPRDAEINRAALARGGRCYEEHLGEARNQIGYAISSFESAINTQDPKTIDLARAELTQFLNQIEGETFL